MMKNIKDSMILLSLLSLSGLAVANPVDDLKKIEAFKNSAINPSPIEGMYFITQGDKTLLVDKTGRYIIDGEIFERKENAIVSLKAKAEREIKAPIMKELEAHKKDFAFYPSKWTNEKGEPDKRATIYVFSDITCPYCKHFHNDMDKFQRSGVEIYYVPFPRKGLEDTGAVKGLQKILCSTDKENEYNKAFLNPQAYVQSVKSEDISCNDSYEILSLYGYADKLGVIGTPAIFTEKGSAIFGYQDPLNFAMTLKQKLNDEHFDGTK